MNHPTPRPHAFLLGTSVSSGIARGTAFVCRCAEEGVAPRRAIAETEMAAERARFEGAVQAVEAEFIHACENVGDESRGIIESAIGLLHDPMFYDAALETCRRDHINAEAALNDVMTELARAFGGINDPLIRTRLADVRDVARRVMRQLVQPDTAPEELPSPDCILVTQELLPSVAIRLNPLKIRGVIAEQGASTAHSVILARSAGIPTVIDARAAVQAIATGDRVILDAVSGRIFVNPTVEVEREYGNLESALAERERELRSLIDLPAVTSDGIRIALNANIGLMADASNAVTAGAEAVGLYRTEFVFFAQDHLPNEDEQYAFYRKTAECLGGRNLVVRVLDIGSDKLLPYLPLPAEPNPSLGRRGTRLLLAQQEILRVQLRAVLRLSAQYPVALLFPMISGVDEIILATDAVAAAKQELQSRGIPHDPRIRIGAMIETPAAAVIARHIAREVDFLSIGTNDLVQYLLAADRTSQASAVYYEPLHPAVLATLKSVLDAGRSAGREVSICGEIAGNPLFTQLLLGLGARALSVAPGEIPEIKRIIRRTVLADAQDLAANVLDARTIADVKARLR